MLEQALLPANIMLENPRLRFVRCGFHRHLIAFSKGHVGLLK